MSSDELLTKCLGKTQNNVSLNGVIWKRCPKDRYGVRTALTMSVSSTIIDFNEGAHGVSKVMKEYLTRFEQN